MSPEFPWYPKHSKIIDKTVMIFHYEDFNFWEKKKQTNYQTEFSSIHRQSPVTKLSFTANLQNSLYQKLAYAIHQIKNWNMIYFISSMKIYLLCRYIILSSSTSLPGASDGKIFACNAGRPRFELLGHGRSPEKQMATHSSSLGLKNSMDRGIWQAEVKVDWKESDMTEQLAYYFLRRNYKKLFMKTHIHYNASTKQEWKMTPLS